MTRSPADFVSLARVPDTSDIHTWADFVELRCLTDIDRVASKSDVASYVSKRRDMRKGLPDYATDETDVPASPRRAELRRAARAEDLFKQLEYRSAAFADFYPFTLDPSGDVLRRRARVTTRHKVYLFLLLAANLRVLRDKDRSAFTNAFEVVSVDALRQYMPAGSEVHLFGTNRLNRGQRYSISLCLNRIKKLAIDIRDPYAASDDAPFRNSGDNGLDVVGWAPFVDPARGSLLVFGQCACTDDDEEWRKKQHSTSVDRWRKTINFLVNPMNVTFIPQCYRRNLGEWHNENNIENSLVIDRLRLVTLLAGIYSSLRTIPLGLIDQAIQQATVWD